MFFQPLEVSKIADLYVPDNHYAQGATCDESGNIYVFYSVISGSESNNCIVKYNINNLEIHSELYFTSYPNIGHGNSIAYDRINDIIIILSSNGYVTLVNSSLQVVNHYYTGPVDSAYRFSEIAINDDYMILNRAATNSYYFYKRLNNKLFGLYAVDTYELGRGARNLLQDAFMYNNSIIAISSGEKYDTYLSAIGVNTGYITTYRLTGLEKEIEGGFVINRDAYFVAADGSLYTCELPIYQIKAGSVENPAIIPNYSRHIRSSAYYASLTSELYEEIENVSENPYKYQVARVIPNIDIPFYNKLNYAPERVNIAEWNSFNTAFITNGSLKLETVVKGVHVQISYTVKPNNTQVLSGITLFSNGASRGVTFSADGSDFHTKMNSLFNPEQPIHLTMDNTSLSILLYGYNKTGDAIANFFGIMTN